MTLPSRIYKRTASSRASLKKYRDSALGREAAKRGALKQREQRQAVRVILDGLKSVPCADCGGTFDPVCMDFDHRPGEGKIEKVSTMAGGGFSLDEIKTEIAKCDVVCANCHRIRTHRKRDHRALLARSYPREPEAKTQLGLQLPEIDK